MMHFHDMLAIHLDQSGDFTGGGFPPGISFTAGDDFDCKLFLVIIRAEKDLGEGSHADCFDETITIDERSGANFALYLLEIAKSRWIAEAEEHRLDI